MYKIQHTGMEDKMYKVKWVQLEAINEKKNLWSDT